MAVLKENVLLFASGRKLKIQNGTISINFSLEVSQGYGSPMLRYDPDSARDTDVEPVLNVHQLSPAEVVELTGCMAALWRQLGDNITQHGLGSTKIFKREGSEG